MRIIPVVAVALVSLLPVGAHAEGSRPWLSFGGGFHSFSMGDVNHDISSINEVIAPLRMDELNSGFGFGGAFGLDVSPTVSLALEYERLNTSSEVGDATGSLRYDLPANVVKAQATFHSASKEPFILGFQAGLGMVSSAGGITLTATGAGSITGDISGKGPDLEGGISGQWRAASRLAIVPVVGVRYAKISSTKVEGQLIYNADGSKYSLNYSGLMMRVMVRLYLN